MKKMNSLTPFFIAALFFHSSLLHSLSKSSLSIATVDTIATNAGAQAFKAGGNAFDAAVAAGLVLGVVNGYNSVSEEVVSSLAEIQKIKNSPLMVEKPHQQRLMKIYSS